MSLQSGASHGRILLEETILITVMYNLPATFIDILLNILCSIDEQARIPLRSILAQIEVEFELFIIRLFLQLSLLFCIGVFVCSVGQIYCEKLHAC